MATKPTDALRTVLLSLLSLLRLGFLSWRKTPSGCPLGFFCEKRRLALHFPSLCLWTGFIS